MANENQISKCSLYLIMLGMLVFGTANTLVLKYQDDAVALGNPFTHPYLQCAIMFLGEFSCFILLFAKRWYYRKENAAKQLSDEQLMLSPGGAEAQKLNLRTNINPLLLAIPATCDFMASTLMFVALTMVDASIYQMMRGIIVVICALFSVIFLGRKLYRHHWTGVFLIVAGVAEVGYIAIAFPDPLSGGESGGSSSGGNEVLGIILLLFSQLFAGTMFIVEEKLLGKYYLDPFLIVGTEGMWGVSYYMVLLPIMQYITCSGTDGLNKLCAYGYLENSAYAFSQMAADPWIIVMSFGVIVSIACFNSFGIATTKYASAAQRSTIDTSRTLLIWAFSCLLGLETFQWRTIFGFILLVLGTLMYNEIVIFPCLGFDQYTKEALSKRKQADTDDTGTKYFATSPGAAYDTSRNQRLLEVKSSMARRKMEQEIRQDEGDFTMNKTDTL